MKLQIVLLTVLFAFLSSCAQAPTDDLNKEKVVLIHGWARSPIAMWKMAERLEEAGFEVERIGYSSLNQSMDGIKKEVFAKINACCSLRENKVHFVGHSLGGLLVRSYLGENKVKNLGHAVIMGSPNKGTEAVEYYKKKWYFSYAGPAAASLGSSGSAFLDSLQRPYYKLGVIAGVVDKDNEEILKGPDDGVVRLESAKVDGMTDFKVVNTSHTMMRWDKDIARYTINFLRNGKF